MLAGEAHPASRRICTEGRGRLISFGKLIEAI